MLCSGRTQRFLEMDIDKFMGAITCGGSHTEVEGEVIRDICIPDELVFQVVNEYFPRDTIIHFETRDISYNLHMDEEFFKNHCKLFNLPQRWYAPWKFRTKNTHISKLVMNYKDIQVKKDFEEEFKPINLNFDIINHTFDIYQSQNNKQRIYLYEMGSGANWVSCHIALFLSFLHYFALQQESPMPLIMFFDQPS